MAGANLPVPNTGMSASDHIVHHTALHRFLDMWDVDAIPGAAQVIAWDASANLFRPVTLSSSGSTDLTGTALIVSADTGGTGAYPARPTTPRPIVFRGTTPPATNGSTAGGGGMVLGLDEWRYWSGSTADAGNTVRVDAAQSGLTALQKAQGRANLGIGLTIVAVRTAAQGVPSDADALSTYGEGSVFAVRLT